MTTFWRIFSSNEKKRDTRTKKKPSKINENQKFSPLLPFLLATKILLFAQKRNSNRLEFLIPTSVSITYLNCIFSTVNHLFGVKCFFLQKLKIFRKFAFSNEIAFLQSLIRKNATCFSSQFSRNPKISSGKCVTDQFYTQLLHNKMSVCDCQTYYVYRCSVSCSCIYRSVQLI